MRLPRKISEILSPTLNKLAKSEHVVAYYAWAQSCGEQVAGVTSPLSFSRGLLTVECSSSVWANELTYLSNTILSRMNEVVPDHPVKKLRFIVTRGTTFAGAQEPPPQRPAARREGRPRNLTSARESADSIGSTGLRGAVEEALRRADSASSPRSESSPPERGENSGFAALS